MSRTLPTVRRPQRRRRLLTALAVLVGAAIAATGAVAMISSVAGAPQGLALAVASDTRAAHHAHESSANTLDHDVAAYLASQPTAVWLVPERDGVGAVGDRVRSYTAEAAKQRATPTIVVYGLPERDCGNFSAGGLTPDAYDEWTAEIGDALRESSNGAILILEPDSIALAPECGDIQERAAQLQSAVANVTGDGVAIYIDGGHSHWHSAPYMAELIEQMGIIDDVRGFATNVSNYNADASERSYAHDLSGELDGAHAVIDTSRNGAGSTGAWCNPPMRLVGSPGASYADDVIDTNLWIKAPGESDGTCNGGPPAGTWWSEAAIQLTREVVSRH